MYFFSDSGGTPLGVIVNSQGHYQEVLAFLSHYSDCSERRNSDRRWFCLVEYPKRLHISLIVERGVVGRGRWRSSLTSLG